MGDDEKRDSGSLAKQLMEAKRLKSEYKSQITNINQKTKNINKELKKLNKQRTEHAKNNDKLLNDVKLRQAQLDALKRQCLDNRMEIDNGGSDEAMEDAEDEKFDASIRCKAVTIDGEVFNPQGLLTGGSDHKGPSILQNLQLFAAKQQEFAALESGIAAMQRKANEINARNRRKMESRKKCEMLEHELKVLHDRMGDSAYASISERIGALETELNCLQNENLSDLQSKLSVIETKCADLNRDIKNYESNKQNQAKHVKNNWPNA